MPGYKVLLLDGIDPAGIELIRRTNAIEPIVHDKISRDELLGIVGNADGIIVRSSTAVDRELIQKAKKLRVVGRAGVGVDNVDLDAATERGVLVMNSPGGSTTTTAEHTVAMLSPAIFRRPTRHSKAIIGKRANLKASSFQEKPLA
jgi:D-3-phosphoglycerate dehydrogenase